MSPMHKKVAAAGNLLSEWALALRRSIGEQAASATSKKSTGAEVQTDQQVETQSSETESLVCLQSAESSEERHQAASGENTNVNKDPPVKMSEQLPDIHPELTLAQIQRHASAQKNPRKKDMDEQKLEINTMFDFHSNCALKPLVKKSKTRRSSVAVTAGDASIFNKKSRDFFENHHLNLHSMASSQSNSAVHYLAISPPRIRITDDSGSVGPDMYGMRLKGEIKSPVLKEESEEDSIGELIDRKKCNRRTSNSSTSSSSASSVALTRNSSVDVESRRSSATGNWSHRSRLVWFIILMSYLKYFRDYP